MMLPDDCFDCRVCGVPVWLDNICENCAALEDEDDMSPEPARKVMADYIFDGPLKGMNGELADQCAYAALTGLIRRGLRIVPAADPETVMVSRETASTAEKYLFWACERSEGNDDDENEAWWELCRVLGIDSDERIAAPQASAPATTARDEREG